MKSKEFVKKIPFFSELPQLMSDTVRFDPGDPVSFLEGIYKQSAELVVYNGIVTGFRFNMVSRKIEYQITYYSQNNPAPNYAWVPVNQVFESVQDAVDYYLEQMFSD